MLDDIIQNTTLEYDGEVFSYRQICARWEGECFTNDILNLDYILPEVMTDDCKCRGKFISKKKIFSQVETGNLSLSWPIMLNPVSWDGKKFIIINCFQRLHNIFFINPAHAFPVFFGGTKVSDDASYIVSVPSLHLVYFVTADTKRQDAK